MGKRKNLTKTVRFEVFKRDSFTCQYCGAVPPGAVLEVDHIKPVSKGGTNELINLVTSCFDCNRGKGSKELGDDTAVVRQQAQLKELADRKEQLDMMIQWREELDVHKSAIEDYAIEKVNEHLNGQFEPTKKMLGKLKLTIKRFGIDEFLEAVEISANTYLEYSDDENLTRDSVSNYLDKIGGICRGRQLERENPDMKELYYIRGICAKRFNYVNRIKCLQILSDAHANGAEVEDLKHFAKTATSWTAWQNMVSEYLEELRNA